MQDRPTAGELLDAAREFLETEIMPELTGRKQFHVRVTVNVLKMLGREWAHEEDAVCFEWARLQSLLDRDDPAPATYAQTRDEVKEMNAELSRRIRAGEFDDRFNEALSVLRVNVEDKLRIANPAWIATPTS